MCLYVFCYLELLMSYHTARFVTQNVYEPGPSCTEYLNLGAPNPKIFPKIYNDKIIKSLCFKMTGYLSLDFLRVLFTLIFWIQLNYISLTNEKAKDKEHLKLRCLVQVYQGLSLHGSTIALLEGFRLVCGRSGK